MKRTFKSQEVLSAFENPTFCFVVMSKEKIRAMNQL